MEATCMRNTIGAGSIRASAAKDGSVEALPEGQTTILDNLEEIEELEPRVPGSLAHFPM